MIFDEERIVEEVARAICAADEDGVPWDNWSDGVHTVYRDYAVAALAAYRATQDGDLRARMADVADNLDYYAGKTTGGTAADGLEDAAGHVRDALAGAQDGGAEAAMRRDRSAAAIARAAWDEGYQACYEGEQRCRNPFRAALAPQAGDGAR